MMDETRNRSECVRSSLACEREFHADRRSGPGQDHKQRVIPIYLDRTAEAWLEAAESLLLLFREGTGMTPRAD